MIRHNTWLKPILLGDVLVSRYVSSKGVEVSVCSFPDSSFAWWPKCERGFPAKSLGEAIEKATGWVIANSGDF